MSPGEGKQLISWEFIIPYTETIDMYDVLALLSLQDIWLFPLVALLALMITVIMLIGASVAQRSYHTPDAVLLRRSPWPLLAPTLILVVCGIAPLFVTIDTALLALVLIFGLLFYASGIVVVPLFFVADQTGLTRQVLFIKKTLPWQEIDWIYGSQISTSYKAYGLVKVAQTHEQHLVVEAGPNERMRIPLRVPMMRVRPDALLQAIQERATRALFGYDQRAAVYQQRQRHVPGFSSR